MRGYLDRGYTTVKMEIGGAPLEEDLRRVEAVLAELAPGQRLAVDANGRFDIGTAIAYAKALSQYDLFWYEEAHAVELFFGIGFEGKSDLYGE